MVWYVYYCYVLRIHSNCLQTNQCSFRFVCNLPVLTFTILQSTNHFGHHSISFSSRATMYIIHLHMNTFAHIQVRFLHYFLSFIAYFVVRFGRFDNKLCSKTKQKKKQFSKRGEIKYYNSIDGYTFDKREKIQKKKNDFPIKRYI